MGCSVAPPFCVLAVKYENSRFPHIILRTIQDDRSDPHFCHPLIAHSLNILCMLIFNPNGNDISGRSDRYQ